MLGRSYFDAPTSAEWPVQRGLGRGEGRTVTRVFLAKQEVAGTWGQKARSPNVPSRDGRQVLPDRLRFVVAFGCPEKLASAGSRTRGVVGQ